MRRVAIGVAACYPQAQRLVGGCCERLDAPRCPPPAFALRDNQGGDMARVLSPWLLRSPAPVLLLALACASPTRQLKGSTPASPGPGANQPVPDTMLVCTWERPTGSNIPERVCRTEVQMERERQSAQDAIRAIPRNQVIKDN
jgi:hypothetical protein